MNYFKQLGLFILLFTPPLFAPITASETKKTAKRWASYIPSFCAKNKAVTGAAIAAALAVVAIKFADAKYLRIYETSYSTNETIQTTLKEAKNTAFENAKKAVENEIYTKAFNAFTKKKKEYSKSDLEKYINIVLSNITQEQKKDLIAKKLQEQEYQTEIKQLTSASELLPIQIFESYAKHQYFDFMFKIAGGVSIGFVMFLAYKFITYCRERDAELFETM